MTTTLRDVSSPGLLIPQDVETPDELIPVRSAPTDGEEAAARRSVARAMWFGIWIWPSYTLLDVYMCFVAYPDAPFKLFVFYRVIVEIAFVAVYRASVRDKMDLKRLVLLQNATYVSTAVVIALMAIHLGGIRSPYMHGISIVALVRTALVASEWRKGVNTYAGVALAFPVVMAIGAIVSPAARHEWLSASALIFFGSHYIFVLTSSILGLITGHIVWRAQEQLYQARRVGRYRLQAPIGKGGMGEVWLAWDETLHRNIALKILRVGKTTTADVRRFEIEARAAGKLRGPHVVRVFDFGASEDGLYYLAMEYLTGMNVATLVQKFGLLPPARAIHLAIHACIALEEAHEAGIIHRDLKPHNLFVTHLPDEPDFLKLVDFGIARLQAAGIPDERLTKLGLTVGTPTYLAPELWLGGQADERSDIYAFGVTLYFMLTGVTPFDGMSMNDLRRLHLSGSLPPLNLKTDDPLNGRLEKLIARCLAWSPDDRVQSVRKLHETLHEMREPDGWTRADAEEFWAKAEKARFN
jgi:serine/threonine-protein kinase